MLGLGLGLHRNPFLNNTLASLSTLVQKLFSSTPTGRTVTDSANTGTARTLQQGRCYHGDGTDDYVSIPDSTDFDITDNMTVCCWAKNDNALLANIHAMMGKWDSGLDKREWMLTIDSNEKVAVYLGSSDGSASSVELSDSAITPNEWAHYAFTFSGGTVSLYRNGVLLPSSTTGTHPSTLNNEDASLTLLAVLSSGTNAFEWDGQAFDFRIYNKVLTASELTHVVSFGKVGDDPTTTNLVAQYKSDEQEEILAYDSSGNENHGTITNATLASFHTTQTVYSFQNQVGYTMGKNIISQSEDFSDTSTWTTVNASVTANTAIAPDGTMTADTITSSASNGGVIVLSSTPGSGNFAGSVYFKNPGSATSFRMNLRDRNNPGADYIAFIYTFSTQNLNVVDLGSSTGAGEVEDVGDGWFRLKGWTTTDFTGAFRMDVLANTSGESVYVWGAQGEQNTANEVTSYQKTSTRPTYNAFIPRNESSTSSDAAGNTLEFTGKAPQNASLIDSYCGDFDGTNDQAISNSVILSTTDATQPYTFSLWVNTTGTKGGLITQYIGGEADRFGLRLESDKFNYFKGSDLATSTTSINDGVWHHCVASKASNGALKIYIDGILEDTGTDSDDFPNDNTALGMFIGATATNYYNGLMSDARIYDVELTAENILFLYDPSTGTDPGTDNLIAHWPLQEGYGTTFFDVSGNDYHCELEDATLSTFWATVQDNNHYNITKGFDGALTFDGTDDLVSFGNVLDKDDTDSFSIEGWFYITSTTAGVLFAKRDSRATTADAGYSIDLVSSGAQLAFRVSDGTTQVTTASGAVLSPDGEPIHFVVVCNRSTDVIQIYTDGTLRDTDSISAVGSLTNSIDLQISGAGGATEPWPGSVGRIRMYGGALTADNVTYLYTGGASGTAPTETLDADWKLNDGRGTLVHDSSGNDYIGTFTSAPVWTRVPAKQDGTSNFTGATPTNPAGAYHNNAETDLNLNPSTTPELANIYREGVTLDGTGDWVSHGNVLNKGTTDNFTISFWYRTTSTTTAVLFAKRNSRATAADAGYSIDMTNSGTQLVFRVSDGTTSPIVASGTVLQPDGVWHHLTAVLDRTNEAMALYVDGSLLDDTPSASLSGLGSFTNSIALMTGSANTNDPFTGDIANVIMFNKALNATEIAALCSSGTIPASVDLRVPYMGDYLDYSSNNYHGTPAGDPAFTSYTVPTDLSFEESLGEQRNHFKKVVENQHAYALFNGTSSDLDILNPAVVAAGTIVIDFYTSTVAGTDRTLFDVGGTGNAGLVIRSDSAAGFEVEFGTGAGTSTITDTLTVNRWHRAAVRWSGANIEVYIDGVSQGSSASASLTTIGTNDQFIGAVGGSAGFHSGGIRNVWVYTSDKGGSFCTSNGTPHAAITDTTNLTAYYRLEKDAKDYSGKYRDGTPANLTFTDADQETTMLLYNKGLVGDSALSSATSQTATT